MNCPHCAGTHVIKKGTGRGKQRYGCRDCGHRFGAVTVPTVEDRAEVRQIDHLKRENASLRAALRDSEAEVEKLQRVATIRAGGVKDAPPRWLAPLHFGGKRAGHRATLMTILSDTHLDEVVRPSEVDWINAYSREIAEQRLERYFRKVIEMTKLYGSGITFDGAVFMLGGDLISGAIHDELVETNEATVVQGILHWTPRIAAGISSLADEFGKVHVPVVVGNHPRMTKRPRAKLRALDNADWLMGQMIADRLAGDKRITFDIPDSTDAFVRVYNTGFLLTHGDQTQGGGGIGGIWPPVMRMRARKLVRYGASGRPFDHLVMGHYHQLISSQGIIVNGSVVGYNEFAAVNNFAPERAQQALWFCTPEHGVTIQAPVICDDPKAEGWGHREVERLGVAA